jgi:Tfp pilus assembly protein PilN
MRPVNLMRNDRAQTRGLPPVAVMVAAIAPIAAIAIVAAGYSYEHGKVQKSESRLAAVQAEIAAIPPRHTPSTSVLASIATARNGRQSSLDAALANRFDLDGALISIARVMPSDVWLTQLSLDSPTPADTPPPAPATTTTGTTTTTTTTASTTTTTAPTVNANAFTITGYTYSQASVANLLSQLSLLPQLSDVSLTSTQSTAQAGSSGSGAAGGSTAGASGSKSGASKTLVQFSVSAAVNPSPGEEGT